MEDQYGRPIGTPAHTMGMTKQEKMYLSAIATTAQDYLSSIVAISNDLQDAFETYPNGSNMPYYRQVIDDNLELAKKLRDWSANNVAMERFPANYDELEVAKQIAANGKRKYLDLRNGYRDIVNRSEYFLYCVDQLFNLTEVGKKSERIYVLLLDAQGSVSEDKYTVDPSKLTNLPPDN